MAINKIFLLGNLTRDIELRHTPSGKAVANFGLAINEHYKTESGETKEETCFCEIVAWGRQAEACADNLAKGSQVFIEGKLTLEQWTTDKGEQKSKTRIRVQNIQFLNRRKENNNQGNEDA